MALLYTKAGKKEARKLWKKCAICETTKNLIVDHDHYTDLIRGVLCNACNTGLGVFHDSLRRIKRAELYLLKAQRAAITFEVLECWLGPHLTKKMVLEKISDWRESGILNLRASGVMLPPDSPLAEELIAEVLKRYE